MNNNNLEKRIQVAMAPYVAEFLRTAKKNIKKLDAETTTISGHIALARAAFAPVRRFIVHRFAVGFPVLLHQYCLATLGFSSLRRIQTPIEFLERHADLQ